MSIFGFVEAFGLVSLIITVGALISAVVAEYGHKALEDRDWNNHT